MFEIMRMSFNDFLLLPLDNLRQAPPSLCIGIRTKNSMRICLEGN